MTPAAVAAFAALRATRDGIPADIVAERLRQELVALELLAHHHGRCPTVAPPRFDAIHASPPCQSYSTMSNRHGSDEPELIEPVREMLQASGRPWVIENVVGARRALASPLMLHGGQFGLDVYRPRLFESNVLLMSPPPAARPVDAKAVYGRQESPGRLLWTRADGSTLRAASLDEAREAMGMPWASWNGCREAIPPAYTEWIGAQLLQHVEVNA